MPPLCNPNLVRAAVEAVRTSGGNKAAAARSLGVPVETLKYRLKMADRDDAKDRPFVVPDLPSFQASTEEIIKRRIKEFKRRSAAKNARKIIRIPVRLDGPVGILFFGDPHLDDPGTNLPLVMRHMDLVNQTEGLFGACVGDFLNNWRGKLARLHAAQSTTQQEAVKLLEWFVGGVRNWLLLIGGNHDIWQGDEDALIWLTSGIGSVYEWHDARIALQFRSGQECRIHARHDFPGSSVYNRAQGATRAIRFRGKDHLYINGHKHTWAHYEEENPVEDLICHAVQVGSYKEVDDFADSKGYEPTRHGAAVIVLINPYATDPHEFLRIRWDIEKAAKDLARDRAEWKAGKRTA